MNTAAPLPALPVFLDPVSLQTKCNTSLRCCHGTPLRPALARRPVRHCQPSRPRPLDPPDRCRSGSRAIDDRSRAEAQCRPPDRLQARLRRGAGQGPPLERLTPRAPEPLRDSVLAGLARGWSPEQVCGSLARRHGRRLISPETIYRFIQAQIDRHTDYTWRHYLPRAKANADAAAAEAAARPSTSRTASPS